MIKIVPATTLTDFKCISKLAHIIWHEHYPSIIGKDQIEYMLDKFNSVAAIEDQIKIGFRFFKMTYNDEPVGYMAIKKEEDYLYIGKLYVLKSYRGKGIATRAMELVESLVKSHGLSTLKLHVNKYNTKSIMAYEKLGFVKTESTVTDIGQGFVMDDYVMEKKVKKLKS